MSIRDRMINAIVHAAMLADPDETQLERRTTKAARYVDAQLAACPEIAALDLAREGWLEEPIGAVWLASPLVADSFRNTAPRMLVIDAPEASS